MDLASDLPSPDEVGASPFRAKQEEKQKSFSPPSIWANFAAAQNLPKKEQNLKYIKGQIFGLKILYFNPVFYSRL